MNAGLVDLFGASGESSSDSDEATSSSANNKHSSGSSGDKQPSKQLNCLPPEVEKGNIEYKLKLIDPTPLRFEHLVTQMKWRLQEGLGEAIYEIGVGDDGSLSGLTDDEMTKSLETLKL
jgi:hypothetical protein